MRDTNRLTRRGILQAGGIALAPAALHSQPAVPPEWAAISPGVVDLAANSLIPIYNQERISPGSTDAVSWAATYGSLASMFRQWDDCGLSRYIQESVPLDRMALRAGPPPAVFGAISQLGMSVPDGWWAGAMRGLDSIRSSNEFQHGVRAMLQATGRHAAGFGPLRAKRVSRRDDFSIFTVQDWDIESTWTKVGGIFLILSGAIGLAFGTPVIVGVGVAMIGIGVAFVAL